MSRIAKLEIPAELRSIVESVSVNAAGVVTILYREKMVVDQLFRETERYSLLAIPTPPLRVLRVAARKA